MNVAELRAARRSHNTRRAYAGAWGRFTRWCEGRCEPLPADPYDVAEYLAHLMAAGKAVQTIQSARAAIRSMHMDMEHPDPTTTAVVRETMSGAARAAPRQPRQAPALDADAWRAVRGVLEASDDPADRQTLALLAVMRCGMLRRSEATSLLWEDYGEGRGCATVLLRRSKTDQEGEGHVVWLSPLAREYVRALPREDVRIFPLADRTAARRIRRACERAGLRGRFSGHSPRIGMACDLATGGASLVELQQAGRWTSPKMPGRYTRRIMASRNPVARWHREHSDE